MGSLMVLAVGIALMARTLSASLEWVRRHGGLVLVLAGLSLYSLSGHIYAGMTQLTAIDPFFPFTIVTSMFRAAGRFFWPVSYAVVFIAFAAVARRKRLALAVLPIALILQWQDIEWLRRDLAKAATAPAPFDYSQWPTLADRIERIEVQPLHGCSGAIDNMRYVYFQIVAGRLGVPINTGYQARITSRCGNAPTTAQLEPGTLFVDLGQLTSEGVSPRLAAGLESGDCVIWHEWTGIGVCLPGGTTTDWERVGVR